MGEPREDPWYGDGLRFSCTQCGACCTGQTGYVWVTVPEAAGIATKIGLTLDAFGARYLRRIGTRYSLIEDTESGACVFLHEKLCTIHEARPGQCRSFPFWSANMQSADAWKAAALECEGIDDEAELISAREIDRRRLGADTEG